MAAISSEVAEDDHGRFVKLVLEEFENLHEGNAIRFGIRPLEFAAWQEKIKQQERWWKRGCSHVDCLPK
jgi:hypothetical protein